MYICTYIHVGKEKKKKNKKLIPVVAFGIGIGDRLIFNSMPFCNF